MKDEPFVDYYEVLQVSPNADGETIARIFRHLAKRYHPDNPDTGNAEKFQVLSKANTILSEPDKRAAYDVKHSEFWNDRWKISKEASDDDALSEDMEFRVRMLSLLYIQRRRNVQNPGMGILELSRLLGCTSEQADFHIWYQKEKGWIQRLDNGQFCITAAGVDQVEETRTILNPDRLIPYKGTGSQDGEAPKQTRTLKDHWPRKGHKE